MKAASRGLQNRASEIDRRQYADDQHGVFGQRRIQQRDTPSWVRRGEGCGICRAGNGGRFRGTKMPALRVALFQSRMSAPIGEWTERVMISGSIFVQYSPQVIARITEDEKTMHDSLRTS